MLGFLSKRPKRPLQNTSDESPGRDSFEALLDKFGTPPPSGNEASTKRPEDDIEVAIKAFKSHVENVKEVSLRLEELGKMLKSGELSENVYRMIMDELGDQLSISVEEIFRLREVLEITKAKAKLEWAKEKVGFTEPETKGVYMLFEREDYTRNLAGATISSRWESMISKIDSALSTLTIEEELSIIKQYLSLIESRFSPRVDSAKIERAKMVCEQRLSRISEKWASIRRDKLERVINLELKASQIKEKIKEIEVRYAVGELDQGTYEYTMSDLRASLNRVQKTISELRKSINNMDTKMFRCSELLRQNP